LESSVDNLKFAICNGQRSSANWQPLFIDTPNAVPIPHLLASFRGNRWVRRQSTNLHAILAIIFYTNFPANLFTSPFTGLHANLGTNISTNPTANPSAN
jgi:hypothetical protein